MSSSTSYCCPAWRRGKQKRASSAQKEATRGKWARRSLQSGKRHTTQQTSKRNADERSSKKCVFLLSFPPFKCGGGGIGLNNSVSTTVVVHAHAVGARDESYILSTPLSFFPLPLPLLPFCLLSFLPSLSFLALKKVCVSIAFACVVDDKQKKWVKDLHRKGGGASEDSRLCSVSKSFLSPPLSSVLPLLLLLLIQSLFLHIHIQETFLSPILLLLLLLLLPQIKSPVKEK